MKSIHVMFVVVRSFAILNQFFFFCLDVHARVRVERLLSRQNSVPLMVVDADPKPHPMSLNYILQLIIS